LLAVFGGCFPSALADGDSGPYELVVVLEPVEPVRDGFFGGDIGFVGDLLVVGEWGAGRAHVYDRDGHLVKTLLSPGGEKKSHFGASVAILGDVLVVGEWNATNDGVAGAGLIHFFDSEGNLIRSVGSPEPYVNARFGWALDSDGARLAVSETGEWTRDENTTSKVWVLDRGGAFLGNVERPVLRMGSFGWSVAIRGNILVVGEPYAGYMGSGSFTRGYVHVWDLDGWGRTASFGSPVRKGFGNFGNSVSVGEDVIVVGEVRADANSTEMAGLAHLYGLDGVHRVTLYPRHPKRYGYFGLPVVVGGDYVAVGQAGYVYLYNHAGVYVATVSEEALAAADYGNDIAIDGDMLAVGSMLSMAGGKQNAGAVYLYRGAAEPVEDTSLLMRRTFAAAIVVAAAIFIWSRNRRTASITRV